ncbi:MAG TPA: SAM-dependent methyltransferase [Chloroflexota bacterium]|nr:SAM-dependent methyltransferase [Chloroflexota bacterium]
MAKKGSLIVVGSGIKSVGHITIEARGWIAEADIVLYLVADPATAIWIRHTNANCIDLSTYYDDAKARLDTYREITDEILRHVRKGLDVCAVFYGHPGVFARSPHEAIRSARAEGFRAAMLPAVSALDCLFADLGVDPAYPGCQMFEATDFLVCRRQINTACHVILWQIGFVGDPGHSSAGYDGHNLPILIEELQKIYGRDYEVVHYQAAQYPVCPPLIQRLPLSALQPDMVSSASTLYIPPMEPSASDPAMAHRLGLHTWPDGRAMQTPSPYRPVAENSRLAQLLHDLSCNPRLLARYHRDPEATISLYGGLSEEERDAILSRAHNRIGSAMLAQPEPAPASDTYGLPNPKRRLPPRSQAVQQSEVRQFTRGEEVELACNQAQR